MVSVHSNWIVTFLFGILGMVLEKSIPLSIIHQ